MPLAEGAASGPRIPAPEGHRVTRTLAQSLTAAPGKPFLGLPDCGRAKEVDGGALLASELPPALWTGLEVINGLLLVLSFIPHHFSASDLSPAISGLRFMASSAL